MTNTPELSLRPFVIASFVAVAVLLGGAGCAGDFAVRRARPVQTAVKNLELETREAHSPTPEKWDAFLLAGIRAQQAGQPQRAAGFYLRVLENLSRRAPDDAARRAGNFATARLVEICAPRLLSDPAPLVFDSPDSPARSYRVSLRQGTGPGGLDPTKFTALVPADQFALSSVPLMSVRAGVGAPLIAHLTPVAPFEANTLPAQPISGLCWAATTVATFGPHRAGIQPVALALYDPHDAETVERGAANPREPLAADFTSPLALSGSLQSGRRLWLTSFFRGDAYFSNAGLYPIEAPTPDKIPVILVHGLLSDPSYFRYIANALANDPEVRRRYQIWVFFYPTALPVPASTDLLRTSIARQLDKLDPDGIHPALHRIVMVGHSMGGLLTRLTVSGSGGDTLYRQYFRQPIDDLHLSPENRALLRRVFFFPPNPNVRAAIFIATPHRGSDLALTPLGGIGRMLAGLPAKMSKTMRLLTTRNPSALSKPAIRGENSVFGLSPRSPVIQAMDAIPLSSRKLRFYSIIGDRGRSGPRGESSDGIVPYRSSHLPEALHETIVHSGHSGTLVDPATASEIIRTLCSVAPLVGKKP